ncbi:MAG: SUMF1/EgtB/PvdO family nonheme iron enzyme, partial [Candidatus Omnitrophica bacterium]|nr:SUMF1/EgtB/PvdO family nonheme iron enzyme [Candidatus Omnitrophota bacterium]
MTKIIIFYIIWVLLLSTSTAFANNLEIENISLTDKDSSGNTYDIEFDISWDNSWYNGSAAPDNYDAAWVFAKFSKYSGGSWSEWAHCTLSSSDTDHVAPAGSTIDTGLTTTGKGVFIYRDAPGNGSNNWDNAQIRWEYGTDGVEDFENVRIKVFGIEMVYVPQGPFYIGDADNDQEGCFFTADGSFVEDEVGLPQYTITSEGAITVGTSSGNLYYDAETGSTGDRTGPIPAAYPKGYNAFYVMKYELAQGQYVDFLNTLNGTQQANRVSAVTAGTFMDATAPGAGTPQTRNGIVCDIAPAGSKAGVYAHNLDEDGVYNESTDGKWIACNWLSWMDGAAYADWAALRPYTELEFEKVARGPQLVVDDEYAWGSTDLTQAEGAVQSSGEETEVANTTGNGLCNYDGVGTDTGGPLRAGFAATGLTNRLQSGGSYYGAMELSGNLMERLVTVGNDTSGAEIGGRAFDGAHGNGILSAGGYSDVATWPGYNTGTTIVD